MMKFFELLDHFERQIAAGRTLIEIAQSVPGIDEMELISLEEEMDSLEMRIADIVDEAVTMREVDALESRSKDLYRRLLIVGQAIAKT